MIIGVPKEIKTLENRVSMTRAAWKPWSGAGTPCWWKQARALGSGLADAEYEAAGASLVSREAAWGAQMVVKVKEPVAEEYGFLRNDLLLFTYLHLAAEEKRTKALLDAGTTSIAYETVQLPDGSLPLLTPMSRSGREHWTRRSARTTWRNPRVGAAFCWAACPA
jgi:alanine dehydrogenase